MPSEPLLYVRRRRRLTHTSRVRRFLDMSEPGWERLGEHYDTAAAMREEREKEELRQELMRRELRRQELGRERGGG